MPKFILKLSVFPHHFSLRYDLDLKRKYLTAFHVQILSSWADQGHLTYKATCDCLILFSGRKNDFTHNISALSVSSNTCSARIMNFFVYES